MVANDAVHNGQRIKKKKRIDVQMEFVPPKDGQSCPFVGYFPSGFDPLTKLERNPEDEGLDELLPEQSGVEILAYQNADRYKNRQQQLVVKPERGAVDFVGTNYMGEAAVWQPGSYALGVFNKENKSLKLVPLSGGKIFRMEPRVRGVDYEAELIEETDAVAYSKETMLQKRNLLTSTFGTQKNRLRLSRRQRGTVKEGELGDQKEIGRLFERAGKNAAMLTRKEALEQANASVVRNVPPHDMSAATPEKAYIFEQIITMEEQKSLGDVELLKRAGREQEKAEELRKLNQYPAFVLNRLHTLGVENDDEGNTKRGIILSYMRHLLAFYNFPRQCVKLITDPVGFHGEASNSRAIDLRDYLNIPHAVVVKILKLFTTQSQDVRAGDREARMETVDNRNLLISYILVLGLMVDRFQADPYDLALALKMPISNLKPHYLELGCTFHTVKQKERVGVLVHNSAEKMYRVTLQVPLEFPKLQPKMRQK